LGIKRFKKNHTEETTAKSLLCNSDPDYYCAVLDPGQHTLQEYAPLQAACALLSADNSAAQLAEIQRATRPYIFYKIERNAQNLYIDTDRMKADSDTAFEQATAAKPQWRQKEYFAERDAFKRALPFYRYDDLRTAAKAIDKNGEEPDRFVGSLQAFQQAGKPLLLTTLEHSGTFGGTGHWTSQYIYGNDTIPPTHATIINRDSCRTSGTTHISGFLKRFIHNLLHLKLPTREQAQHLARSISAEGIASGYEEEITIKVPNMVTSIHTGRSFQDGWIDAPTTPSAAPEAPATSE
jgi:hypothetical protein